MITWQQMFYITIVIIIFLIIILVVTVNKNSSNEYPLIINTTCPNIPTTKIQEVTIKKNKNIYLRLSGTDKVIGMDGNGNICINNNIADPLIINMIITSSDSYNINQTAKLEIGTPCNQLLYGSICIDNKLQNRYINLGKNKTVVHQSLANTEWNFTKVSDNTFKISNRVGFWKTNNIYGSVVVLDHESNAAEWEIIDSIEASLPTGNYTISLNEQKNNYLNMDKYMNAIIKKDEISTWTLVKQNNFYYFKLGENTLGYTVDQQNKYIFKFSADNRYPRATFRVKPGPNQNTWYFIFFALFCPNDQRCGLLLGQNNNKLTLESNTYPPIYWTVIPN